MSATYSLAVEAAEQSAQEGCARLEIRVPMARAQDALARPPSQFAKVMDNFSVTKCVVSPPVFRTMRSSLTLGAMLIYMLNALNYRPAEGQAETELTSTCCWNLYLEDLSMDYLDSDEDEDPVPIMLDHGLYFISGVWLQYEEDAQSTLRMGGGDKVSMDCIQRLYRVYTDQDLKIAFHVKTLHGNHLERNNNRTQNRRTVPVDVRLVVDREELAAQNTILADKGIQLPGLPQETGPDIVAQQQGPYGRRHRHEGGGTSQMERAAVQEVLSTKRIHTTNSFPKLSRMRYFREWNTMMESLSSDDAQVVRDSFWQTFKSFKWLPLTDTDRIWNTKRAKGPQWTHIPQDYNKPTVQIGVNGTLVQNATNIRISVESPVEEDPDSDSSMEL
ncbi:hypothetical protein EDB83DRAFT_2327797 [Lactarius deliciosus]|nr:hypothetical protein EDB83DRAFT_2327797 [Lactarius deliciosus]